MNRYIKDMDSIGPSDELNEKLIKRVKEEVVDMKKNEINNSINLETTGRRNILPMALSICAAAAIVCVGGVFLSKQYNSNDSSGSPVNVASQQSKEDGNSKTEEIEENVDPMEKRDLTENELKDMTDYLNGYGCYGFLLSEYSDIRNANLYYVFYDGAGLSYTASKDELDALAKAGGYPLELDVVSFKKSDAANLVNEKTGLAIDEFNDGFDGYTYLEKYDAYYSEKGDSNYRKISCESGSVYGDTYTINYKAADNYFDDDMSQYLVSTVVLRLVDGEYQFVSNTIGKYNGGTSENKNYNLSDEQLKSMSAYLGNQNKSRYGFLLSSYDDIMDVNMKEVLHNGAGIRHDPTQEEINCYLNILKFDGLATDLVCMSENAIDEFLNEYTGHSLAEYKEKGSFDDFTYVSEFKSYDDEHGDTNYQTITCISGTVSGDIYTIDYSFGESGVKDGTVVIKEVSDGQFQFVSNECDISYNN